LHPVMLSRFAVPLANRSERSEEAHGKLREASLYFIEKANTEILRFAQDDTHSVIFSRLLCRGRSSDRSNVARSSLRRAQGRLWPWRFTGENRCHVKVRHYHCSQTSQFTQRVGARLSGAGQSCPWFSQGHKSVVKNNAFNPLCASIHSPVVRPERDETNELRT
jgi:hypothetical protein